MFPAGAKNPVALVLYVCFSRCHLAHDIVDLSTTMSATRLVHFVDDSLHIAAQSGSCCPRSDFRRRFMRHGGLIVAATQGGNYVSISSHGHEPPNHTKPRTTHEPRTTNHARTMNHNTTTNNKPTTRHSRKHIRHLYLVHCVSGQKSKVKYGIYMIIPP